MSCTDCLMLDRDSGKKDSKPFQQGLCGIIFTHVEVFVLYSYSISITWCLISRDFITSAKEDMFSPSFVRLSISSFAQKLSNGFA